MYMYHNARFRKCKIQNVIHCKFLLAFYITPKLSYTFYKTDLYRIITTSFNAENYINSINNALHTVYHKWNKQGNFLFFLWFYSLVPALTTPEQWNYTFKKLTLQGRYSYMSNLKKQRPSWETNSSSATHFQLYHCLYQSHEVQLLYVVHKNKMLVSNPEANGPIDR